MMTRDDPFCAVCLGPVADRIREPLGRNGGMVLVCHQCREEPVPQPPTSETKHMVWRPSRPTPRTARVTPLARNDIRSINEPAPGTKIKRVSRSDENGRRWDANEACAWLESTGSVQQIRYLRADARWFYFETRLEESAARP
jgi:hypothetical protein